MSRPPFDKPGDIAWQDTWIASDKQMDMIGLNSQFNNLPLVFGCHFLSNLVQSLPYRTNYNFLSSLRAENNMVDNQMNIVVIMFVFHVDTVA